MASKQDFLEMEASLRLNEKSQIEVSTRVDCQCLPYVMMAAVHILDLSRKKMSVKMRMMMMMNLMIHNIPLSIVVFYLHTMHHELVKLWKEAKSYYPRNIDLYC